MLPFTVPASVSFADLRLALEPNGQISYNPMVITSIAQASGLPGLFFMQSDAMATEVIFRWYSAHRLAGGAPDPVAEQLIAEASRPR